MRGIQKQTQLTIGGWDCSELTSWRYLLILRDGSMRSWRSLNNRWYLLGNFSQDDRSRDTAPWPSPETIANIELKFLHSLHCPAHRQSLNIKMDFQSNLLLSNVRIQITVKLSHSNICVCVFVFVCVFLFLCLCVCVFLCVCVSVCVCFCVFVFSVCVCVCGFFVWGLFFCVWGVVFVFLCVCVCVREREHVRAHALHLLSSLEINFEEVTSNATT
jgi:hypothetical protein